MSRVPPVRIRAANEAAVRADGRYVVYWMTAFRRVRFNFALQRAAELAEEFGRPLVILEALRVGYPWASERLHRFVIDGMADNRAALASLPATYHAYVEPEPGAGSGLLQALAEPACVVVGDDYPAFFLPRMVAAAARRLPIRLELVDSNGILPLRAVDRLFTTAHSLRRVLQRVLPEHLDAMPLAEPLAGQELPVLPALSEDTLARWPAVDAALLDGKDPAALAALPIGHEVAPVPMQGGAQAARRRWDRFLSGPLERYADDRNHPDADAESGLSAYLHFGHISSHELVSDLLERHGWGPELLAPVSRGQREGWWGLPRGVEAFLDQLVTWRELGFNLCWQEPHPERWETLPAWARATLLEHAQDPRPELYTLAELEAAATADPLWNAAQRQLLHEGVITGYLRMLWGKKILQWSATPEEALERMVHLNDRWALDGRDPNSYSGIGWVLGRYDRAWGPERPIFGKVRYMTSDSARRKLRLKAYLERWGGEQGALPLGPG